jgi:hypothetical protein
VRFDNCIIPYVMLDENATIRLAIPRSTIAIGTIETARYASFLSLLELFSEISGAKPQWQTSHI